MLLPPGFGEAAEWKLRGSCRTSEESPDLWFSERTSKIEKAKAICLECPVMITCLEWALKKNEPYGIWGGMDHEERLEWERKRKS